MTRAWTRRATALLTGLAALALIPSCEDALRSREAKNQIAEIKQRVTAVPSSIDTPDDRGEPPLHIAVSNGYRSLVDWLLTRGADPAVRDRRGRTPLHEAVYADRPPGFPVTALLLRHGVSVDATAQDGSTPLHLAAATMRTEAAAFLLESGARIDARTRFGETPLHRAAAPQPTASDDQIRAMIHLLVAHGAAVETRMHDGRMPLHVAALSGSSVAAEALLAEHADPDARGNGGQTPLHVAAVFARPRVAEVLLTAGADVNRRDDQGRTPLWLALHGPAASTAPAGRVDTAEVAALLGRHGATEDRP